jgi:transcriptional regulator with XRE-family HTH domain
METTVGERIKKILYQNKINATEMADKIGMKKQAVNQIMNGTMKISYNFVYGIAINFPSVDLRWLILGERTEGYLTAEELPGDYYSPIKERDKQITELLKINKEQNTMIKELLSKIPSAK